MPRYQFTIDGAHTAINLPDDGEAERVAKDLFIQYLIRLTVLKVPFQEPRIEVNKFIWSTEAQPKTLSAIAV